MGFWGPFTSSDCDVAVTSLTNLFYYLGVVLLHQAFVTATATDFAVTGESLYNPIGIEVAVMSQTSRCRRM